MRRTLKRRLTAIALGTTLTVSSIFTGGIFDTFTGTAKAADGKKEVMMLDFGVEESMVKESTKAPLENTEDNSLEEPAVQLPANKEYKFDFNITGSKNAEGWHDITVNKKSGNTETEYFYTPQKGYGLGEESGTVEGREEGVGNNENYDVPKEAYTDFALLSGKEFKANIKNGTYLVEVIVGSTNSNTTKVVVEDMPEVSLNPGKSSYGILTINDVVVSDSQLNIKFNGDGRVNGIIITDITPVELNFDFNITGSKTAEGWTGVTVNKKGGNTETDYLYNTEKGYGFFDNGSRMEGRSENVGNNESYNFPNDMYTDFALASGREFAVDIDNGVYALQFIVGSTNSNTTKVVVEDMEEQSINPGKEAFGVLTITGVEVTDGQLNMRFSGDGRLNGIAISSVSAPTNLEASVDYENLNVCLNWSKANGVSSYNVYRTNNNTKVTTKIANVSEVSYVDTTVELLGNYTYFVKGISLKGIESAPTNEILVELKDESVSVPEAPQKVKVINTTEDSTTISWDPVKGAILYQVYWSDRNRSDLEGTEGYAFIKATKETTFTYEKPTHMKRYFKVVAVNAGGYSKASEAVLANTVKQYNVQTEYLDRGLVAMMTDSGVYVGWRLRGDEYKNNTSFELFRDGKLIKTLNSTENTNYIDKEGTINSVYTIKAISNGVRYKACNPVHVLADQYLEVKMEAPAPIYDSKLTDEYQYIINDTSLGDADGDGEYDLYVKWDPSNSKDNSKSGFTGPTFIDCYKLDGTLLFRINLGFNIRSGAHYTQYQVFDFDGDGKSEIICKTADGTIDGVGNVIGNKEADYRNGGGYVLDGPEYLTLFDGLTGEALDTIDYNPARGNVGDWGDTYGNRVDRFLAGVAYLDGEHPSAIFSRGYYTRAVVCAYDVNDKKLVERWVIDSNDLESNYLYGQGAHSLTVSDVDNDGCQEVVYGSATIDHDGTLLYSLSEAGNGYGGHGDAQRVGDFNLKNPGMEIFMVHESKPSNAGIELHNGADGNYVFAFPTTVDTGRGSVGDIDPRYEGAESWAIGTARWDTREGMIISQDGDIISNKIPAASYTIYWDGDLGKEIVDHTFVDNGTDYYPLSVNITKWNWNTEEEDVLFESDEVYSNNGTKGNPCFQADIFGDWREEVAWRLTDNSGIRIYSTVDPSEFRLYTFMHDAQYRAQVACEVTGYNQPPTQSFYVGFDEELIAVPTPNLNMVNAVGKDEPEEDVTPPTEPEETSTEESNTIVSTEDIEDSTVVEENSQETEEETTTTDSSEKPDNPSTGDDSPFVLILVIMVIAIISGSSMVLIRRKRNKL